MSTQNDWEKRYEEFITFVTNEKNWIDGRPVWKEYKYVTLANAIKYFIRKELADARREERAYIIDLIQDEHNFTWVGVEGMCLIKDIVATLREEEGK